MSIKILISMALAGILVMSCADRHSSPVLVERGSTRTNDFEGDWLATKEGYGIDNRLKKVFLQGYVEEGMNVDMVNLLWGPADREFDDGRVWEYIDHKTGKLITRLKWDDSKTKRLGRTELVVVAIEGDRYGGSPPPVSESTGSY